MGAKYLYRDLLTDQVKRVLDKSGVSDHLDTGIMMAGSTVVLHDWLNGGNNLGSRYRKFMNVHGGFDKVVVHGISAQIRGEPVSVQTGKPVVFQDVSDRHCQATACEVLHPGNSSCTVSWTKFFLNAFYKRSVPMYARLFAIPLILGLMRGRDVQKSFIHFGKGVAQSSAFFALYCAAVGFSVCLSGGWPQAVKDALRPAFTGAASGAALLVEKKGRRIEVALYVLTNAIATLVNKWRRGGRKIPDHLDTVVSMVCCSFLLHEFVNEQEGKREKIIRPAYRFLLERLLDSGTDRHASIVPGIFARSLGSLQTLNSKVD